MIRKVKTIAINRSKPRKAAWLVLLVLCVFFAGCQAPAAQGAEPGGAEPGPGGEVGLEMTLDREGRYTGFDGLDLENLPTAGCYVMEDGRPVSGSPHLQEFIDKSVAGEEAALRIIQRHSAGYADRLREDFHLALSFNPEDTQVADLFFQDGVYRVFTPEMPVMEGYGGKQYPYLVLLEDTMTSWGENHCLALSESLHMDYSRFYNSAVFSSLPPFTTILVGPMDEAVDYSSILGMESWQAREMFRFDEDGKYTGFQELPKDYTWQQANDDGCYVNFRYKSYLGEELLDDFISKAQAAPKRNLYLRIAIFVEDEESPGMERIHYEDLFYWDGQYYCFTSSDEGNGERVEELRAKPYKMLRQLIGGRYSNPPQTSQMYVLTDDVRLTMDDIVGAYLSSQAGAVEALPPFQQVLGIRR